MMKVGNTVANIAALGIIAGTATLGTIAVLGVWDYLDKYVVGKSLQTIGLIAFAALIAAIAMKFLGRSTVSRPLPIFSSIKRITLSVLAAAVTLLAFLGVLAIWDILGGNLVEHVISTLGIIMFVSLIIVAACLEREYSRYAENWFSFPRVISFSIVLLLLMLIFRFFW